VRFEKIPPKSSLYGHEVSSDDEQFKRRRVYIKKKQQQNELKKSIRFPNIKRDEEDDILKPTHHASGIVSDVINAIGVVNDPPGTKIPKRFFVTKLAPLTDDVEEAVYTSNGLWETTIFP